MVTVKKISRIFPSVEGEVAAVNKVSFTVPTGTFASIVGTSGSGKTTLLSLLGTLEKLTEGSIEIDGVNVNALSDHKLIAYRRKKIGFIFQGYNLIPNLTALENVMLPLTFVRMSTAERKRRSKSLLEQVGLVEAQMYRKPSRLSGGQQQRVAIARALVNKPALVLADEPTGNLDTATGKKIFDLLHGLARAENTTIIVVTHDMSIAGQTDITLQLQDGTLVE
jgi:putative ABC transport system ATP-binding protein